MIKANIISFNIIVHHIKISSLVINKKKRIQNDNKNKQIKFWIWRQQKTVLGNTSLCNTMRPLIFRTHLSFTTCWNDKMFFRNKNIQPLKSHVFSTDFIPSQSLYINIKVSGGGDLVKLLIASYWSAFRWLSQMTFNVHFLELENL